MLNDMKLVKNTVEDILKDNVQTRDSDDLLYIVYLNRTANLGSRLGAEAFSILCEIIKDSASYKTITRNRRLLQSENKYLGSKKISQIRKKNEEEMRGFLK